MESTRWLSSRKLALVNCVVGIPALLAGVRNSLVLRSLPSPMGPWQLTAILAPGILVPGILFLFYFAFYRDGGPLRITTRFRWLALSGAVGFTIFFAIDMPWAIRLAGPWRGASVLDLVQPWSIWHLSGLLSELANLAHVLLLIALFREASDDIPQEWTPSRFLRIATAAAAIVWGLWVAYNLLALIVTPLSYFTMRKYVLEAGRTPPSLASYIYHNVRGFFSQACLVVAPIIVFKSLPRHSREKSGNEYLVTGFPD